MNKIFSSLNALYLSAKGIKTLNYDQLFRDKRVAIVGPADSAFEKQNGEYIDNFDFVIRINKAPSTWKSESESYTGTKTDVWFHSFFENEDSGGGTLSPVVLKDREVSILVNPRTTLDAYRRSFYFYRKYGYSIDVYHLPKDLYMALMSNFSSDLKPTIGLTTLYTLLNSKCKELFITGFTFFKTPYAEGYRDHLIDMKANENHIKRQGQHDTELEYEIFKVSLKNSLCSKVDMDKKLEEILISDPQFSF